MSQARDAILARLSQTSSKQNSASAPIKKSKPARTKNQHSDQQDNKKLLIEKLKENRAEVYTASAKNWTKTLLTIAHKKALQTWLIGHNLPIIDQANAALQKSQTTKKIISYSAAYETLKESLFHQVDASITTVKAAIAETGTLLLIPDQYEPRMLSLVPPIHIAILLEEDIVMHFQDIVDQPSWFENETPRNASNNKTMPTNILFISSPSKTADIQQTIAYGAHGPKELIVIIISQE